MSDYKHYVGLGVAGNFALHLEQAGESADFKDVVTDDPNGPKGVFPFYVPGREGQLGVYPLSSDTIVLPKEECNVQPEPEVALLCELEYDGEGKIISLTPTAFGAYNDCSLRKEGAAKISHKKNWGAMSKGLSDTLIPIDRFEEGGIMDRYRIASFLRREGGLFRYGEDVELLPNVVLYPNVRIGARSVVHSGSVIGAAVTGVTPVSTSVYTVSVSTGSGDGTLGLDIPAGASITDLAELPLSNLPYTGPSYTVDKTAPTVLGITRADPNPTSADQVGFSVIFSEPVTGVEAADFIPVASGLGSVSVSQVIGSGDMYTVTVNTGTGSGTLSLGFSTTASIYDLAGNLFGGYTGGEVYTIVKSYQMFFPMMLRNDEPIAVR